jgi:hypothetical protein
VEVGAVEIGLWIAQGALALAFAGEGIGHAFLFEPFARAKGLGWMRDVGPSRMRMIGALEFAAAVGLIAPAATGILPWLTPLAAVGLVALMLSATIFHLRRPGEMANVVLNVILGAIALFVAVGRFWIEPF